MASATTTLPVAAHVVGDAFVKQYYTVLHHSPQVVHRFYTDSSKLTRAEAGADGTVHTAVAQEEINNEVMSLDPGHLVAEIKTIDSQESLRGGVLVMVTGSLASKNNARRDFVQTFFLAPQEKGFFVLNDMLRYLEAEPPSLRSTNVTNGNLDVPAPPAFTDSSQAGPVAANARSEDHEVVEGASAPAFVEEAPSEEAYDSNEQVEAFETEEAHPTPRELQPLKVSSALEEPTVLAVETEVSVHDEAQLRLMKENPGLHATNSQNGVSKPACNNVDQATAPAPVSSVPASIPAISDDGGDGAVDVEHEGDGRLIYVKNLSMNIIASQLEEEFVKFGAIRPNGINVRSQKQQGFGYAFVEFEDATSVQSAIDASPIMIGGRPAFVQEKRPASSRGRGRILPGRGDRLYRNDGMRGRGFFGGRGQGRTTGQDRERDIYFRGRGSTATRGGRQNHGATESSIPSTENHIRYDLQGSNSSRPQQRGVGNHQATRNGSAPPTESTVTGS
ncbi:hypothetical protein O6H91_04G025200 [Diphasiastrum complanatum]|uniref:Uncharacterized protein n=2 Tax=Diphasiastrum complanatum TaxID=34168 RepID=A0ACC2DVS7_DIPCM|nr:hypothetical protein O6H91_04G025200 [Diphasiastrum complanatum]KAJ7558122.1 hypothetical protein O6H91_04G025200 [Diphasiastrum complanatum]